MCRAQVQCTYGKHLPGPVTVSVTTGTSSSNTLALTYGPPTLTSVATSPSPPTTAGGATLTLTGTGFWADDVNHNSVQLNGGAVGVVSSVTATTAAIALPARPPGCVLLLLLLLFAPKCCYCN